MPTETRLELPNVEDANAIDTFIEELHNQHADVKGVKKVARSLAQYLNHRYLTHKHLEQARKSIDVINGVHAPYRERKGGSLQGYATKFYSMLNDETLKTHCKAFRINYELYDNREEIIEALIHAHIGDTADVTDDVAS